MEFVSAPDSFAKLREQHNRRSEGHEVAFPYYFEDLQETLGGIPPGCVRQLAGLPGSRKSTYAAVEAQRAAKAGHSVRYISVELTPEEVTARLVASEAKVPPAAWVLGMPIDSDSEKRAADAANSCGDLAIARAQNVLFEDLEATFSELESTARKEEVFRTPGVYIDFIQALTIGDNGRLGLQERVASSIYQLQELAATYQVALTVVSSVARGKYDALTLSDANEKHGPQQFLGESPERLLLGGSDFLAAGKQSGDLEYALTASMALLRVQTERPELQGFVVEVLAKARYARTDGLRWFGRCFGADGLRMLDEEEYGHLDEWLTGAPTLTVEMGTDTPEFVKF